MIVGTVGDAYGEQPAVVARLQPRDYGVVGVAVDIRIPPWRTVLGEYVSGARAMTEVFRAATPATPGAQMVRVPALMYCPSRWVFRYLAEGLGLTPARALQLTAELVETLEVGERGPPPSGPPAKFLRSNVLRG